MQGIGPVRAGGRGRAAGKRGLKLALVIRGNGDSENTKVEDPGVTDEEGEGGKSLSAT
jgi:hypothetical protein